MGGRIAFDALKNRGELAALDAAVLYRAGTPVVKVLLGTPAVLASLTALEPYRPLFVVLTIAALGTAGWRLYGPASRCEDGRVCADPKILRRRRRLMWVVVVAVLPLLLFPYYVSWFA